MTRKAWSAADVFEDELERRGVSFEREAEDLYVVDRAGTRLTVNLENRRRDAERDDDPDSLRRFVDDVLQVPRLFDWEDAKGLLLLSLESSAHDFHGVLHEPLTDELSSIVTLWDAERGSISWVGATDPARWGLDAAEVLRVAAENQDRLLVDLQPEIHDEGELRLGMIPLDSPYKASVLLAPGFRAFIEPHLGWPVRAVVPCRDFVYVFPEDDELTGRLDPVVVQEFRESGYPLSTEVLELSDRGIRALGRFRT